MISTTTPSVGRIRDKYTNSLFVCFWRVTPPWARSSLFMRFLDHTQRHTTVGRISLDEWSAPRTNIYLTTHNDHDRRPCPRWNSNPQSQKASGRKTTPLTLRPLG